MRSAVSTAIMYLRLDLALPADLVAKLTDLGVDIAHLEARYG